MMKYTRTRTGALGVFLLALTLSTPAMAGPWTKNSGEFYVKIGESLYMADSFRNAEGVVVEGADYLSATTMLYGEYGILDGLHVMGYLPWMFARNTFDDGTFSDLGFGDAIIGLQASPLKLAIPTSLRLDAKVPLYTGDPDEGTDPRTPARGDAQVDITAWLSAGGGLPNIPLYFFADVGYQHRTTLSFGELDRGPFSDGFVFATQVGYNVMETVIVAANASGVIALKDDDVSKSYIVAGPSLFFPLNDTLALEANASWTPYSRNSAAGFSMGVGVSFRGQ